MYSNLFILTFVSAVAIIAMLFITQWLEKNGVTLFWASLGGFLIVLIGALAIGWIKYSVELPVASLPVTEQQAPKNKASAVASAPDTGMAQIKGVSEACIALLTGLSSAFGAVLLSRRFNGNATQQNQSGEAEGVAFRAEALKSTHVFWGLYTRVNRQRLDSTCRSCPPNTAADNSASTETSQEK